MNKCTLNEFDSFKMYFQASITNNEKWAIPKLFFKKIFTGYFPSEHHFRP